MKPPRLIIVRGLPGSGKTTFALDYIEHNPQYILVERDHFRYNRDGKYIYDNQHEDKAKQDYCRAIRHLVKDSFIITTGTFLTANQISNFLIDIGHPSNHTALHTLLTKHQSIHAVPDDLKEKMSDNFESDHTVFSSLPLRRLYGTT